MINKSGQGWLMLSYHEIVKCRLSISAKGELALPSALLNSAGIGANDKVFAEVTHAGILLTPCLPLPLEIYSAERIADFDAMEEELRRTISTRID